MATDALDARMARLEGAYEQFNERLGALDGGLASVRAEISSVRGEIADLRRQTATQFYWLLTFVLGSILVPLLRDLTP